MGCECCSHPCSGSSPRVWGARLLCRAVSRCGRLIPTCVGSTSFASRRAAMNSAHPHVCGEHGSGRLFIPTLNGSSPRVWGALRIARIRSISSRLIPTCVGSTRMCGLGFTAWPAHPHVCGEHISRTSSDFCTIGSSPRVWGAPVVLTPQGGEVRLIPTCVGSTLQTG